MSKQILICKENNSKIKQQAEQELLNKITNVLRERDMDMEKIKLECNSLKKALQEKELELEGMNNKRAAMEEYIR